MTNEETLKWFKDDLKNGKCSDERRQCNAMEKAIEALEKQTPKAVKLWINPELHARNYPCPECGEALGYNVNKRWTHYCPNCGQALSWPSAEDEKSTIVYCKYCQYWHGKAVPNVLAACTFKSNNIHTVYTKAHDTCAFGVNAIESKKTADK